LRRSLIWLLCVPVWLYRYLVSPVLGPRCRFLPTCSEYALDALAHHGPLGGSWLTLRRVVRCHPWGGSGYDPVPEAGGCRSRIDRAARSPVDRTNVSA
jgi:putative membrane protein insertion efficiency factor